MLIKKLILELIWLLLTLVVICLVLLPIYTHVGDDYIFYKENIFIIFISVTFIRYIFLTRHHWISESKIGSFYDFQSFSDEAGLTSLVPDMAYKDQLWICKYIRVEFVFFFAAAFISNFMMPFRMIVSLWREINKGTH